MKASELDISSMNDFELKGILLSLIGKAKRKQLLRIIELFKSEDNLNLSDKDIENLPYALTPEQEAELMISLEETYHDENMITLEESKQKHSRWLKQ